MLLVALCSGLSCKKTVKDDERNGFLAFRFDGNPRELSKVSQEMPDTNDFLITVTDEDGKTVFWIDENINPFNGDWISRTRLKTWKNGGWDTEANWVERGKDYNHSTFADLIINGLVGIQPQLDGSLIVEPLAPDSWEFFAVDEVPFRGKMVSVLWDKDGSRYGKGAGFAVYVDGVEVFRSKSPGKVKIEI